MAKAKAQAEPAATPERPKKKKNRLALPLIAAATLVALAAVLHFNIFSLRDRFVYPLLRRVPIVQSFVPAEAAASQDPIYSMGPEELRSEVLKLKLQLEEAEAEIDRARSQSAGYLEQVKTLQAFEEQQVAFKQDKAAFDEMIALQDPDAFASYYERISPENAERLYPRAAGEAGQASQVKKYAQTFAQMDESSAAAALEQLIPTDMDLVVMVMGSLGADVAGEIFDQMSPANVAAITKRMAPVAS
jgi:flagellar motility protein MotE (MotC chaperone)